jgi:hypothetical protein
MKKIWVAALAVSCVAGIASADNTTPATQAPVSDSVNSSAAAPSSPVDNVSQSSAGSSTYQKLKDMFQASYFGDYRGGNPGQYGNGLQPGTDGNPDSTSPQGIESYVTTGYKFAPDWMAGVTSHFFYNETDSTGPGLESAGFRMLNPSIVISKANLINSNGFKLKGYIYGQIPVSNYDYISVPGRNMVTSIQPTANLTYDIKGTRWTLGLYNYITAYIPGSNTPDGLRTYKLYQAPYVNYQMTPTVAATLWVDLFQITRKQGTPFITGMDNYMPDLEPGVNWDVIPGYLSLNPMLNIYPGHATLASTSFQMVIVGSAF